MATNLAQQRAELEKTRREAREEFALYEFYKRHEEVCPVESNSRMLKAYHNGEEVTLATLEESLQNPDLCKRLAFRTPDKVEADNKAEQAAAEKARAEERERLVSVILSAHMSPEMRQNEARQLRFKDPYGRWTVPIERLRERAQLLEESKNLRHMSSEQLKAEIRRGHPDPTRRPLPQTAQYSARALCQMSAADLRRAAQVYGLEQLNTRLREPIEEK